jgi:hypothetical protein
MNQDNRKRGGAMRSGSPGARTGKPAVSASSTKRDRSAKISAEVIERAAKRFKAALTSLAKK